MSSSDSNNNSTNGPSQVTEPPSSTSTGSSTKLPAQNENTSDQLSPPSNQASTNGVSQYSSHDNTPSYTGLLSQNGSFGDHFWSAKSGGRSGNSVAGSTAGPNAVNASTKRGLEANGAENQGDESKAGDAAEAE